MIISYLIIKNIIFNINLVTLTHRDILLNLTSVKSNRNFFFQFLSFSKTFYTYKRNLLSIIGVQSRSLTIPKANMAVLFNVSFPENRLGNL